MVRDSDTSSADAELLLTSPMITTREGGPNQPDYTSNPQKYSGQVDHKVLLRKIARSLKYEMTYKSTISIADKDALEEALFRTQFVTLFIDDLVKKFTNNSPERYNLNIIFEEIFSLMNPILNGSTTFGGFYNIPVVKVIKYGRCLEELVTLYYVPNPMQFTKWERLKYWFRFDKHK